MRIRGCVCTESGENGAKKAVMLKVATSIRYGRIAFAVLSEAEGEDAHAEAVSGMIAEIFSAWFTKELPQTFRASELALRKRRDGRFRARVLTEMLQGENERHVFAEEVIADAKEAVRARWTQIAHEIHLRLQGYLRLHGACCTAETTCLLLAGGRYLVMHVGDSRAYCVSTPSGTAEAKTLGDRAERLLGRRLFRPGTDEDPLRRICGDGPEAGITSGVLGSGGEVLPAFVSGVFGMDMQFLLCDDAFLRAHEAHRLTRKLSACFHASEKKMERVLQKLVRHACGGGGADGAAVIMLACGR